MLLREIISIALFLALINGPLPAITQKQQSIDDLLNEVFNQSPSYGTPTATTTTNRPVSVIPSPGGGSDGIQEIKPCAEGECVEIYQCDDADNIITDGSNIFDVRIDVQECPSVIQRCCKLKSDKPKIPVIPIADGCGYRNTEGNGFRVTGAKDNEAQFAEFPWMVAILKEEQALSNRLNVYVCGGSLLAPNVVLTGAHCVHDKAPSELKIRAGEWDTNTKLEIFPHQDRDIHEFIIHEQFNRRNLFNDIALIVLKESVQLAENVNTICLPPPTENFDNKRCFVSGWGKDQFGKAGTYSVILKRIELPLVAHNQCEIQLRKTRLGVHFKLNESFVCAGGERGRDTCTGDGGSPLICPIPGKINRYYQAGIVAWGIGCNDPNIPGVYVNVPYFRDWIDKKLTDNNYNINSYVA